MTHSNLPKKRPTSKKPENFWPYILLSLVAGAVGAARLLEGGQLGEALKFAAGAIAVAFVLAVGFLVVERLIGDE
jgi:hypothetical protein